MIILNAVSRDCSILILIHSNSHIQVHLLCVYIPVYGVALCCRGAEVSNKPRQVRPQILSPLVCILPRRDEFIEHGLRLGHTDATQSCLLRGDNPPQCAAYCASFTVEHLLVDCRIPFPFDRLLILSRTSVFVAKCDLSTLCC
jgi:hypothetical protein